MKLECLLHCVIKPPHSREKWYLAYIYVPIFCQIPEYSFIFFNSISLWLVLSCISVVVVIVWGPQQTRGCSNNTWAWVSLSSWNPVLLPSTCPAVTGEESQWLFARSLFHLLNPEFLSSIMASRFSVRRYLQRTESNMPPCSSSWLWIPMAIWLDAVVADSSGYQGQLGRRCFCYWVKVKMS